MNDGNKKFVRYEHVALIVSESVVRSNSFFLLKISIDPKSLQCNGRIIFKVHIANFQLFK
jgi:hypothetical protein